MHDSLVEMIVQAAEVDIDVIGWYHSLVWEAVHEMGGDDYDYDDVLDIIGV